VYQFNTFFLPCPKLRPLSRIKIIETITLSKKINGSITYEISETTFFVSEWARKKN